MIAQLLGNGLARQSALYFNAFFQYSNQLVLVLSHDWLIVDLNQSAELFFGLRKEAALYRNFFELCRQSGVDLPVPNDNANSPIQLSLQAVSRVDNNTTKEGMLLWNILPLREKQNINGMLVTGVDITAWMQSSHKANNNPFFNYLIDILPYAIFWKDKNSVFQGCNKAFATHAGLTSPQDIIGKTDYDMPWTKEESATYRLDDKGVLTSGKSLLHKEELHHSADGRVITISVSKVPLINEQNEVYGVLGIYHDVTNQKIVEKEFRDAIKKAEVANHAKLEFIRNISHDIRTPLSGIIGMAHHLQEKCQDVVIKQGIVDILQAGSGLLALFNEVIEMIRSEATEGTNRQVKFCLQSIVTKVVAMFQPCIKEKGLKLEVQYDPKLPRYVLGNNSHIYRIIMNLLGNAVKFTEKGSITVAVELAKTLNDKVVIRLIVKDTGIGIPKDKHSIIFERFERLTPSYENVYKGTGLGLYIVRQFVEEIKGEIYVDSEVNEGSTFTCVFPVKMPLLDDESNINTDFILPEPTDLQILQEEKLKKSAPAGKKSDGDFWTTTELPRILLVEDNLLAQKTAKINLESWGNLVDVASNGREGLLQAQENKYDLIYMDVGLPDLSGPYITRVIRTQVDNPNRNTPIVALTAHVDDEVKAACVGSGMNDVIAKPLMKPIADEIFAKWVKIKTTQSPIKIIDWELADSLANGSRDLAREMLNILLTDLPNDKWEIAAAFNANDFETMLKLVHKLHGAVCYCGTPRLKEAVFNLEVALKLRNEDVEELYHILCEQAASDVV